MTPRSVFRQRRIRATRGTAGYYDGYGNYVDDGSFDSAGGVYTLGSYEVQNQIENASTTGQTVGQVTNYLLQAGLGIAQIYQVLTQQQTNRNLSPQQQAYVAQELALLRQQQPGVSTNSLLLIGGVILIGALFYMNQRRTA